MHNKLHPLAKTMKQDKNRQTRDIPPQKHPFSVGSLADLLLAPLYLAQGVWVRFKTPRLPEPPGLRQGVSGQGRSLRLLVTGDSSAAGVGAPSQNQALTGRMVSRLAPKNTVHWRLAAQTGWRSRELRLYLAKLPRVPYDLVLLATGINDLTSNFSLDYCLKKKTRLVAELRNRFTPKFIVVSGMPPVHKFPALPQPLRTFLGKRAKAHDQAVAKFCQTQPDCEHLPLDFSQDPKTLATDGFHPGPQVYDLWAKAVVRTWREK